MARHTKHSTRLSQVHEAALEGEFRPGQRVQTIDGLPGRVLFVSASFAPGVTEYEVHLDNGMGQGTYTASQLRPVPEDYRGGRAGIPPGLLPAGVTAVQVEASEAHLASEDYPEMGSVLLDRPDPGQHIKVIGHRTAADTYGRPDDARDEDYNGGEQDLGMYWAEPGQQQWVHDNIGPQEEALPPPVPGEPDELAPPLARLAQIEEAAQFFGGAVHRATTHRATTINGQQIDEHGDAPEHGTRPRAKDPKSYDEASTEGEGDPIWTKPLMPKHKQDFNGAMVAMYPEGIYGGDGPGIVVGPVVAGRVPWTGQERSHLHSWDNEGSAQPGDFVSSAQFTNKVPVTQEIQDPAPEVIAEELRAQHTAASEGDWASHLRGEHGWTDESIARILGQGDQPSDHHQALHDAGMANHGHPAATYETPFPPVPTSPGGQAPPDPAGSVARSRPGHVQDPAEWSDTTRRRRLSRAQAGVRVQVHGPDDFTLHQVPGEHEHDSRANSLDDGELSGLGSGQDETESGENSLDFGKPQVKGPDNSPGNDGEGPGNLPPGSQAPGEELPPQAWPMTQAPVQQGGPAYTQGTHDQHGRVFPPPPPAPVPAGLGDGEQDGEGDEDGGGKKVELQIKSAALDAFAAAAASPAFRFEFTASWHDVVAKAKRIRKSGRVRITHSSAGMVIGEVGGDHDVYESGIQRPPARPQTIQHWACGCPWASFRQDKSMPGRLNGRPCSHVMALQFEALSRTRRERKVDADLSAQELGVPHKVVVKSMPPWGAGGWAQTWIAPAASLRKTAEMSCPACGDDRDDYGRCYGCGLVSRDLRQEAPLPGAVNVGQECLYAHDGPCPEPYPERNERTAESARHSRPAGFHTEVTPNSLHDPDGWTPQMLASHVMTGYMNGKPAGRLHFSRSDDGQAYEVHMLHSSAPGKGVASALMDDLYSHVKTHGRWLDHGTRTPEGNNWWASYREPHPEVSTHHAHPDEGWKNYWSPYQVGPDLDQNLKSSGGRGAHTPRTWKTTQFVHDDHDEQWAHARGFQAPARRATAVLLATGEDLGDIIALAQLAGVKRNAIRYMADQTNAPFGSENVTKHPPTKPYGATEPPNPDQSPASYGFLSAPDPDNWGSIQEDSALQMPLSSQASYTVALSSPEHKVLVPGAPSPLPAGLNYPSVGDFHEDQESFGFTDRAPASGPSTSITPRDPQGIRMEEARHAAGTAAGDYVRHLVQDHGKHPDPLLAHDYSAHARDHADADAAQAKSLPPWEGYVPHPYEELEHERRHTRDRWPDASSSPSFIAGLQGDLHSGHEPALPSTTGDETEGFQDRGEHARQAVGIDGTAGDAQDSPHSFEDDLSDGCKLCGLSPSAAVHHRFAAVNGMGGQSIAEGLAGGPQEPSPAIQEPGMGSGDEYLMPDDQSIQTMGQQQWSGGGTDTDEVEVPAGQPQGGMNDVVAAFQRSAAAGQYAGGSPRGGGPGLGGGDIAQAAQAFLRKTADALPEAEARELIGEGRGSRARNLSLLRLEGTHYEDEDSELERRGLSLDDFEDDVVSA